MYKISAVLINIFLGVAALGAFAVAPVKAQSQLIFEDHFDDGVLDPAWTIFFKPDGSTVATGWDHDESVERASWLTIREIIGATNPGEWKQVELQRAIPPLGDFRITMRLSWDTPPPFEPFLQVLEVRVLDGSGTQIVAGAGYNDSWGNDYGTHFVAFPCVTQNPGGFFCHDPSSAGPSGEADVEIDRTGNVFTFTWNGPGARVYTATALTLDAELVAINLRQFHNTNFGTLAIDHFSVEGVPLVPTCNGLTATIEGTEGNDTIIGTSDDDVIVGLGGNDTIDALDGSDTVCGGPGNDTISGGKGNDHLRGGKGNDSIEGNRGDDFIRGRKGNDTLDGGNGDDTIRGDEGNDTCSGGNGVDSDQECEVTDTTEATIG